MGKDTFLLEVPESLRGAVPKNYELQSSKKVSNVNVRIAYTLD